MDLFKDLYNNGKIYRLSMDPSGIDISGENQILQINSDKITGNINIDGILSIDGDLSMNGDISLNGDLSMNGDIFHVGDLSMNSDISLNGNIDIIGDININSTSAIKISNGTTVEQPSLSELGHIRYNKDIDHYEGYRKINELLSHWEQFILPAGAVQNFAMQTPPNGWLICDGRAVEKNDYPKLYAAIGTLYGTDGTGTGGTGKFVLPDFRGRFIRGWDDMGQGSAGNDLSNSRAFGSVQDDDNKDHNHDITVNLNGNHAHTYPEHSLYFPSGAGYVSQGSHTGNDKGSTGHYHVYRGTSTNGAHSHTASAANQGTESMPKNIAVLICIKY